MTTKFTFISDVHPRKIEWKIKAHIIRLWSVSEFKNPREVNSIEMILFDNNVFLSLYILVHSALF